MLARWLTILGIVVGLSMGLSGCSVVHINGSYVTDDSVLCVVPPEKSDYRFEQRLLLLLRKKGFAPRVYPVGTSPQVCHQVLYYDWAQVDYILPIPMKQYAFNFDLYVAGEKYANASFDPQRNLMSQHVKIVRYSRYMARVLDRLFPGRPRIGF